MGRHGTDQVVDSASSLIKESIAAGASPRTPEMARHERTTPSAASKVSSGRVRVVMVWPSSSTSASAYGISDQQCSAPSSCTRNANRETGSGSDVVAR